MTPAERRPEWETILIVDDDQPLRERLGKAFRERGFVVQMAASAAEAMTVVVADPPDLAVVDLRMRDRSGLELVGDLKALDAEMKIIVLTGYGSIATAIEAIRLGATNFLPKPADVDDILTAFARGGAPIADHAPVDVAAPSLARVEWEHIQRVLADCSGNISEAARRLGIHRRSLQRKLRKYPPEQ